MLEKLWKLGEGLSLEWDRENLRYWLVAKPSCEGLPGMGLKIFGVW